MKRLFIISLMIIVVLLSTSGCWNRRELTDLAIASAIGIDKTENGYQVSVQIINPGQIATAGGQGGGGNDSPVTTYYDEGETLFETLRKLTKQVPRKIYYSHLSMVVFGEDVARDGISKTVDFLSRDHEMRSDFYIVIARETNAYNILSTYTSLEKIPANKMFSTLENSAQVWAATGKVRLDQLISEIASQGTSLVLTGIRIEGEKEKRDTPENVVQITQVASLKYDGMGVFKEDRLIGWLNEEESKGYNYTIGNVTSTVIKLQNICKENEDENLGIEVIKTDAKMKGQVQEGKPKIDLMIKGEANVTDVECYIDLINNRTIEEIQNETNKTIKKNVEEAIKKAQTEYKIDIFGFGEAIYRSNPQYWREVKDNWDQEFENLTINVQVDMSIERIGTIDNPIKR